jgi:nuclear pore complex protein Nup98-Nup96
MRWLRQSIETSKILALPMTEDRYLKHTVELSLDYYRAIMAGGGGQ